MRSWENRYVHMCRKCKLCVQQGFSSAESNAASTAVEEILVLTHLGKQCFRGVESALQFSGVNIAMADTVTAQGAAAAVRNITITLAIGDSALFTYLHALPAMDAYIGDVKDLRLSSLSFRVGAPFAPQAAALQKNDGSDTRAIFAATAFDVNDCRLIHGVPPSGKMVLSALQNAGQTISF